MPVRDLTRKLYKTLSKKNKTHKRQRGGKCGCGSKQSGGRVVKPAEFYGGNSGRYYTTTPTPEGHAYGKTHAVSFGSIASDMTTTGPNLGPYPNSSGMMTGGANCTGNNRKMTGGANCASNHKQHAGGYKKKRKGTTCRRCGCSKSSLKRGKRSKSRSGK
jgi:hypothetical protein